MDYTVKFSSTLALSENDSDFMQSIFVVDDKYKTLINNTNTIIWLMRGNKNRGFVLSNNETTHFSVERMHCIDLYEEYAFVHTIIECIKKKITFKPYDYDQEKRITQMRCLITDKFLCERKDNEYIIQNHVQQPVLTEIKDSEPPTRQLRSKRKLK